MKQSKAINMHQGAPRYAGFTLEAMRAGIAGMLPNESYPLSGVAAGAGWSADDDLPVVCTGHGTSPFVPPTGSWRTMTLFNSGGLTGKWMTWGG